MEFTVVLKNGKEIKLSQDDYNDLNIFLRRNENEFIHFSDQTLMRLSEFSHSYLAVEEEKQPSNIVRPPTPAELKAQEERNREADDITLEGQLSKL